MKRIRTIAFSLAAMSGAALLALPAVADPASTSETEQASTFRQPIIDGVAADPMIQYVDGSYYLSYNKAGGRGSINLRRATSLAGLRTAPDTVVYDPAEHPQHPESSRHNVWPIGWLLPWEGKFYLYGEGNNGDEGSPRSFVLEADDPWGPYRFKAELPGPGGQPAYQTNPVVVNGQLYLVTARYPELFIARMSDPWTHETDWRPLAQPDPANFPYHCTAADRCLLEGGSPIVRNGRVFLFHSTGGYESPDYCVGTLSADVSTDLTLQENWQSSPSCVLSRNDSAGVYGPGTLNVFASPDGTEQWAVYHVKTTTDLTGEDRRLMAAPIGWNADGTPHLDPPDALDTERELPSGDPGIRPRLSAPAKSP